MPTSIEDRTYQFALSLVRAYRKLGVRDDADRTMWRQLLRAGTSVGANSAEGPGTQSRKEWLTRRFVALKESRESHFWLRLLADTRPVSDGAVIRPLQDEARELVAILTAVVKTARKNDKEHGK